MKQGESFKERLESTNPCIDEYKDVLLSASIAMLEECDNISKTTVQAVTSALVDYSKLLDSCLSIIKEDNTTEQ
jgi:hypothetical protein